MDENFIQLIMWFSKLLDLLAKLLPELPSFT